MTHLPQFMHDTPIDDLVPNRPDDDEATQPVVVTDADLFEDTHDLARRVDERDYEARMADWDRDDPDVVAAPDLHPRDYLLTPPGEEDGDDGA